MMTDAEKLEWGKAEFDARLSDIAAVKAGSISLEQAQKNTRSRARKAGMTPSQAFRAYTEASIHRRRNEQKSGLAL